MTDKGLSIGVAVNLILTVAASFLAPTLFKFFDGWVFIVCAAFSLLCGIFSIFLMKETKGLSEKQIAQLFSSVPIDADLLDQRDE
jgi:ribose/xylose/arabinose/galactoside ABC-type transport system permease subunit